MNPTDPSARWYSPWRAVEPAPVHDDPADMGTAFGLDLSLAPAAEDPAEDPAEPPAGAQFAWMRHPAPRKPST